MPSPYPRPQPHRHAAEHPAVASPAELERILARAEQAQESLDRLRQRRFALGAATVACLLVLAGVWLVPGRPLLDTTLEWVLGVVTYVNVLTLFVWGEVLGWRVRRRQKAEEKALASLVELLREGAGAAERQDARPALERAETRIRLARFGIE